MLQAKLLCNGISYENAFSMGSFAFYPPDFGSAVRSNSTFTMMPNGDCAGIAMSLYQIVFPTDIPRQLYFSATIEVASVPLQNITNPWSMWIGIGEGLYPRQTGSQNILNDLIVPQAGKSYFFSSKFTSSKQSFCAGIGTPTSLDYSTTSFVVKNPMLIDLDKWGMQDWTLERLQKLPFKE